MNAVSFKLPEQIAPEENTPDARARAKVESRLQGNAVTAMQQYTNLLIECLEHPLFDRDKAQLAHALHWMQFYYQEECLRLLAADDRQLFYEVLRRSPTIFVEPRPVCEQLFALYHTLHSKGIRIKDWDPVRDCSLEGHLGEWDSLDLLLPVLDETWLYRCGDPTESDPLALISNTGPGLMLQRTDQSVYVVSGCGLTVSSVRARLRAPRVCSGRKTPFISNDEGVLYNAKLTFDNSRIRSGWLKLELA